ncbi:MAG TPA: glycoside hydrolase family 38 C-terminal domain-containing protein [Candidatus Latescibacteria bacterium]|nr:glycoside hydrolase family 38 C-terminal domain-containing protein [Candidatus Latescibacterota bacterium]HOS65334.1 glycoside hydrolase family 38 C-terminal domain-containing protein [Candidatus Latescibacterota bacterium]HPK75041.1 glycoside hydrolase family 38 C-terminal domain-containing protein [Candidatus Latescibacterota bacterium]
MEDRLTRILELLKANELPVTWKAIIGEARGAESPEYDDSAWDEGWRHLATKRWATAWLRASVPASPLLSEPISGRFVIGGHLTVWVNGMKLGEGFEPTISLPVPALMANGLKIAVKSEEGGLSSEMLKLILFQSPRLRQVKTLRRSLDFVMQWRAAQPGNAAAINDVLARYVAAVDPDAAPDVFLAQVVEANELLRQLDPLAKQYTVHIVPHSHVDLSWGWDFSETKRIARALFDQALRIMEVDPAYTFAQDQPPMYVHLEDSATEKAIARRVKEGRWDIPGATFSEPESFMPGGESWVRHLLYTKRYFKQRFGKEISLHWAPDNFSGHANTLPQIWKLCGINAFVFGNWYQAPHGGQFLWEGLDGTRVFAHYMTSHYDSAQMIEQDKVIRNVCEHMKATTIPACMLLDGDDLTPPWPGSPQGIENLRALAAFPKIEFSTPHRFFSSFDTAADGLRVVQGEFISTTDHRHNNVGAYSTFAEVKLRNRRSEWGLRTLEAMATLAMRDGGIYPTKHAARAWRLTLFNQMHDIFPGTAIFEAYEEAYKRYDEVDSICSIGTNAVANVLASTINTKGDGIPVVLFNTLGWDRNDPAEILLTEPHSYCDGFEVRDGNGRPVPAQTLSTDIGTFDKTNKNFRLLVQPDGIPAIGYKTVWLHPAHHDERVFSSMVGADRLTLDNDFVRVTINPRTGWVSKLFDKRLNRNVLPDGKEACAIEGQGDVGNPWHLCPEGPVRWMNQTVRTEVVEDGDVRAAIRVTTTWHRSTFVQEFRITRTSPRVEVHTTIDCHEANFTMKALIPVALPADAPWTCEVPWGAVQRPIPDNDRATQTWMDVSNDQWGLSVLNNGRYGHSRRADGTMTLTLLRTTVAHKSQDQSDEGRHEFTYALLPHKGNWTEAATVREAHMLNAPIITTREIPHEGARPDTHSMIRIGAPNIVLAALKKAEDNDDWVLHLYETTGAATDVTITFDRPVVEAYDTDLMEWNRGVRLNMEGGTVRRSFRPWEIAGIRIRLG